MFKGSALGISYLAAGGLDAWALEPLLSSTTGGPAHLGVAAILHSTAVLLGAGAFVVGAPDSHRPHRATSLALAFGLCLPIPLVGIFLLACFQWQLRRPRPAGEKPDYYLGERQVLTEISTEVSVNDSPQSVIQILNGTDAELRRRAIIALRRVDPKRALPILQKAIQDSDEQVRLLAQTQFNKIMAGLELAIKRMEAGLAQSGRTPDQLVQLAEQYHELVYLGLSSRETETVYLERAIDLLREALNGTAEPMAVRFLLLKCYIKHQNLPAAKETLSALQQAGYDPQLLIVWQAEIFFQERDWTSVRTALQTLQQSPSMDPRLRHLASFWTQPATTE